jgi:hypothetical protein
MISISQDEVLRRIHSNESNDKLFIDAEILQCNFSNQIIENIINFSNAIFLEEANFAGTEFKNDAIFLNATFKKGAVFAGCTFRKNANFSWSCFFNRAYFWKCTFLGLANFEQVTVESSKDGFNSRGTFPGETNFSWSYFEQPAVFSRALFKGNTYFWRTIFCNKVSFFEASFDSSTYFEGDANDICVSKKELFSSFPSTYERFLIENEIIIVSQDSREYVHFNAFSLKELTEKFGNFVKHKQVLEKFECAVGPLWERYGRNTFSQVNTVSFEKVKVGTAARIYFNNINLMKCLFKDTKLDNIDFLECIWDEQPILLSSEKRYSLFDERFVASAKSEAVLERSYYQLSKAFQNAFRYKEASDFYYGAMEMKRVGQHKWAKNTGLLDFYKYLSGYGEHPGLALGWLLFIIFVFFPALYLITEMPTSWGQAFLRSLESATFLNNAMKDDISLYTRFVIGFERILVPLQAGLFLWAFKQKFKRE